MDTEGHWCTTLGDSIPNVHTWRSRSQRIGHPTLWALAEAQRDAKSLDLLTSMARLGVGGCAQLNMLVAGEPCSREFITEGLKQGSEAPF